MMCSVRRRDIHALESLDLCVSYLRKSQLQATHDTTYLAISTYCPNDYSLNLGTSMIQPALRVLSKEQSTQSSPS
jgi:hypothetical protein